MAAIGTYVAPGKARWQRIKKQNKTWKAGEFQQPNLRKMLGNWLDWRWKKDRNKGLETGNNTDLTLSGLLELELTMLGLPWFIKACGINTATFFSLSVLPMELNVQDSAQLWYPTVPPFHREASLCNPFLTTGTKWSLTQARTFLHVKLNALNHPTRTLDTTPAVRANKDVCSVVQLLNSFLHVCAYTLSPVWLFATHKLGPPDSSVYGICQARILERVAISCSRGSSQPWDWICISCASCIGKQILYHCTTCEAPFPSWELLKSSEPW